MEIEENALKQAISSKVFIIFMKFVGNRAERFVLSRNLLDLDVAA